MLTGTPFSEKMAERLVSLCSKFAGQRDAASAKTPFDKEITLLKCGFSSLRTPLLAPRRLDLRIWASYHGESSANGRISGVLILCRYCRIPALAALVVHARWFDRFRAAQPHLSLNDAY